jgi:hypothetical protein
VKAPFVLQAARGPDVKLKTVTRFRAPFGGRVDHVACLRSAWLNRQERTVRHWSVDTIETKAENTSGAGKELRPINE